MKSAIFAGLTSGIPADPTFEPTPTQEGSETEQLLSINLSSLAQDLKSATTAPLSEERRKDKDLYKTPLMMAELDDALEMEYQQSPQVYQKYFKNLVRMVQNLKPQKTEHSVFFEPESYLIDATKALLFIPSNLEIKGFSKPFCQASKALQEILFSFYNQFIEYKRPIKYNFKKSLIPPSIWTTTNSASLEKNSAFQSPLLRFPIKLAFGGLVSWSYLAGQMSGQGMFIKHLESLQKDFNTSIHFSAIPLENWIDIRDSLFSDLLGILVLGPSGAIGVIGWLLVSDAPRNFHFFLKGLLVVKVLENLSFPRASEWANLLKQKILKEYPSVIDAQGKSFFMKLQFDDKSFSFIQIEKTVDTILEAFRETKFRQLKDLSLFDLPTWNASDEEKTNGLRKFLLSGEKPDLSNYDSKHIIAAATLESVSDNPDISNIFSQMIEWLAAKYDVHWAEMILSDY